MATKKVAKPKVEPKKTTAPVAVETTAPVVAANTAPVAVPEVLPGPKAPLDKAALVEKLKVAKNTVLCGLPINAVAPIDEVIAKLLED